MARTIRTAVHRSRDTLLADTIGALSLVVLLFVGLSLPGLV